MGNSTAMSKIAVVLIILAQIFTIIAISTNYWGELGDTYSGGTYKGLWQECKGRKIFEGKNSFSSCKSTGSDNFVVQLAECLALICGLASCVIWIMYMCQSSRTKTRSKNLKYATVVVVTMAAFFHVIGAMAWGFSEGNISWSFGLAILACVLFFSSIIFIVLSRSSESRVREKRKTYKRNMRPMSRPDEELKSGSFYDGASMQGSRPSSVYSIGQHSNRGCSA